MDKTLYLVEGSQGEYSGYSTWIVNGWLSQAAADLEATRLNEIAMAYEKEKAALGEAPDWISNDAKEDAFQVWCRAHDALEEKWQKISGDEQLGNRHSSTNYAVRITTLKDRNVAE